jgi:2-phosphoglycerate kinase
VTADSAALREQLQHVYWIGGGSGAGKSTIARRIAAQHGLRVYATDDVMADHARRSTREDSPLLHKFMAMDMNHLSEARRWAAGAAGAAAMPTAPTNSSVASGFMPQRQLMSSRLGNRL